MYTHTSLICYQIIVKFSDQRRKQPGFLELFRHESTKPDQFAYAGRELVKLSVFFKMMLYFLTFKKSFYVFGVRKVTKS